MAMGKVQISVIGPWHWKFGMSLLQMTLRLPTSSRVGSFRIHQTVGSILPQMRYRAVREGLDWGMSHILFVDTDQEFPPWTLDALLKPGLDGPVGANIATKRLGGAHTARLRGDPEGAKEPLYTTPKSPPIQRVARLGFGVILIPAWVFEKVGEPWFEVRWRPEIREYEGEDWYFCRKLEEAGIPLYVHRDLSLSVKHWGWLGYSLRMQVPKEKWDD